MATPEFALQVWRRRKWVGVLAFGAACAGSIGAVLSLPNLYRATATVLVDRQEVSEAFVRASVTAELETRIQMIHQRVMSRERLTDLIVRLNLYPDLRRVVPMDALVEQMKRDVQLQLKGVDQPSGRLATISFAIAYSGRDATTVAAVANTLVASYIQENTQSRERQAGRTAEFLQQQMADAQQELDAQDHRTRAYTAQFGDELPQQLAANMAALDRTTTALRSNSEAQLRATDRRERIDTALAAASAAASRASDPDLPSTQLEKLRRELADLQRKFQDGYPGIVRVQGEIAALEAQTKPEAPIKPVPPAGRDAVPATAEVDAELKLLKQQEAALRRDATEYEARIQRTPARQRELEELSRGHESARERYQTLLKQYTDARLAESLEQGQSIERFRVLDPAVPPRRPIAPDRLWLALMGLVASLAVGLGAVFVAEKLDTSFHTAEDLRAFVDLPLLATIGRIVTPAAVRARRWRVVLVTCVALAVWILIGIGASYVAKGNEQIVRLTAHGDR